MLVSTIIVQHTWQAAATDSACRVYSNSHCCRTKPVFSAASLAPQRCWELELLIISWRLLLWRVDWQPETFPTAAGVGGQLVLTERVMLIVGERCPFFEWNPISWNSKSLARFDS